jgi:hypothetical protein
MIYLLEISPRWGLWKLLRIFSYKDMAPNGAMEGYHTIYRLNVIIVCYLYTFGLTIDADKCYSVFLININQIHPQPPPAGDIAMPELIS